jgi:hypothetical protein
VGIGWVLACGLAVSPFAAGATDLDGDTVFDVIDNCSTVANTTQCDTDVDGYGNACDGDFDQDMVVLSFDRNNYFACDFTGDVTTNVPPCTASQVAGVDTGRGTDMDCNGTVNANDYDYPQASGFPGWFFWFSSTGLPGPTGCDCAGICPTCPTFGPPCLPSGC